MLFISPPFGNYVKLPETKSIKGSFTLEPREGLIMQIMKTLRYSFEHGGWVNKIGLRNKGIDWAIKNHDNNNEICSIAILNEKDIPIINKKIPENMNIEINVSCPNAEKKMINIGIDTFLNNKRDYCIVKLSPKTEPQTIDTFYKQGFRQFHCSNTIPIKEGGLSGPKLKPYTSNLVSYIHKNYPDCEIIAGGGIKNYKDINYYKKLGANHTSVSTLLFNPFKFGLLYGNYITGKK